MNLDPSKEPPIDTTLTHYLEQRALELALEKATTDEERAMVAKLCGLRAELMKKREAYFDEATAKRHARGEIYSAGRVAAINSMGPTREALDDIVKSAYLRAKDCVEILKSHARIHFADNLVSSRMLLKHSPANIAESAANAQLWEEQFADAWLAAIGDEEFASKIKARQRSALRSLKTASQPVYLVTCPTSTELSESDALALGKAWAKLDELAQSISASPLSSFLALPTESAECASPVGEIMESVDKLLAALNDPANKLPGKRGSLAALANVRERLVSLDATVATAQFELDI